MYCIDDITGDWYLSALTEYDDDDYPVFDGSWAHAYGRNGSIDDMVWVEHPRTWHFYGFVDDSVHLLQPLLRPNYGPSVGLTDYPTIAFAIATQCDLLYGNSLSSIRFGSVNGDTLSGSPTYSAWDDSPPFSSAITSNLSRGKFSFGERTRSHRSVGVHVSPADWMADVPPPLPMGIIKREMRYLGGQENFSDEEFSYDPYDKE
jgi:hypothetical protein